MDRSECGFYGDGDGVSHRQKLTSRRKRKLASETLDATNELPCWHLFWLPLRPFSYRCLHIQVDVDHYVKKETVDLGPRMVRALVQSVQVVLPEVGLPHPSRMEVAVPNNASGQTASSIHLWEIRLLVHLHWGSVVQRKLQGR